MYNGLICSTVPRSGPRNMVVFDPTTSTLSVSWDHADGPVQQYRITYATTTGDPIDEFVRTGGVGCKESAVTLCI